MNLKKMKIAIIGSGGAGGYFGAKLAQGGFDVTFVARGEHLKVIQRNGLYVKSILGDFNVNKFHATDDIADVANPDLIILGVKAWQVKEVREDIKRIVKKDTAILPLQNGVLAARELKEVMNPKNILGGLCRIISKIETPGVIHHMGVTPTIVFGEFGQSRSSRIDKIQNMFQSAGIESQVSGDIEADLWRKFIMICAGGLLVVSNTTYGELREIKETRILILGLLNEIVLLAHKIGIKIEADFVDKSMSFIDSFPHDSTSSLARDVWDGRPSEIEYQNGTVVRLGKKFGVDTPINRFVYHCILPRELKARKKKSDAK